MWWARFSEPSCCCDRSNLRESVSFGRAIICYHRHHRRKAWQQGCERHQICFGSEIKGTDVTEGKAWQCAWSYWSPGSTPGSREWWVMLLSLPCPFQWVQNCSMEGTGPLTCVFPLQLIVIPHWLSPRWFYAWFNWQCLTITVYIPSSLNFILMALKILRHVFGQVASIKMY